MKFNQMPYIRPELEPTKQSYLRYIEQFKQAATAAEALEVFRAADQFFSHIGTMASLAAIRHSLDTEDAFYDAENTYLDENLPLLRELGEQYEKALLASPHRAALEKEFGTLFFKNIEISLRTFSPEIVEDLQTENRLTTEYDKLIASAQIEWDGELLTLSQLAPHMQSPDRTTRRRAAEAQFAWFDARKDELDRIFDELVAVRTTMAKKLGYENFIGLGYDRMCRNSYTADDVAGFREGIRRHIIPPVEAIKAAQAERIGVECLTIYDDPLTYPEGNPKPQGTPDEIFAAGKKMYTELAPETAEFIDFMLENELFDVLSRKGKSQGGYCAYLSAHKSPFIFANFNGTSGDVDVLTHEAGHAYAAYTARDFLSCHQDLTYETAEVHSMSMEFFTYPWMELFFGEDAARYKESHRNDALCFLPYGTMVDEFQHRIYAEPDLSPAARNAIWRELEAIYRPYLDTDFLFYREGRRWQAQSHIYERPFYYIDYCLAQSVALLFYAASQKDYKAAFAKYQAFVASAGKKTFLETVRAAGLPSPFDPETLGELTVDS